MIRVAERRMFSKNIVLSDAFLDMPMSARCLYFTLGMLADDDGFIGNPKSIMRQCGASQDDMLVLLQKRYVLSFDSGVIVIKHWRMNNYLQSDRHKATTYIEELNQLCIDQKGAYTEKDENAVYTECIQNVYTGKDSIVKNSIGKDNNIYSTAIKEIIDYLNTVLGTRYTYKCESNNKHIRARLSEGHTVDEFKHVIDIKYKAWKDDAKMSKYLRPETLFGTKFESYLNERSAKPNGNVKYDARDVYGEDFYERYEGRIDDVLPL